MPNCGPSHRHFAKAYTPCRASLCGRFLLIVPAPSGNVSRILIPGGNAKGKRGPPLLRRSVTFGPNPGYGSQESPGIGAPPPFFRGTVRVGEQGFQVVGKSCVRKGLVGVDLVEILAGRAERPHGEGRHRRGRRPAMGLPRPLLADLWSLDRRRPPSLAEQGSCQPVGKPHVMSCHEDWDSRGWGTVE